MSRVSSGKDRSPQPLADAVERARGAPPTEPVRFADEPGALPSGDLLDVHAICDERDALRREVVPVRVQRPSGKRKWAAIMAALCALSLTGCVDAVVARAGSYGREARVQCYSGERLIYDGTSTGIVLPDSTGIGIYFRDKASGKFVRVHGDCVVTPL